MKHKKYIAKCTVHSIFRCSNWKSFDQVIETNQNKLFKNQYPESWTKIANEIHEIRKLVVGKQSASKTEKKSIPLEKIVKKQSPFLMQNKI